MLSVLIPIYNYEVTSLVNELHEQLLASNIDFEIIGLDDKSKETIYNSNTAINNLSYTRLVKSSTNKGIAMTRQDLCEMAKNNWLLFVDADTKPKSEAFVSNYLEYIESEYDAIFGGFSYKSSVPSATSMLRWKYGKTYESLSANKRNKKPYKVTIAANLLIRKKTYERFNLGEIGDSYGMDILFGSKLKQANFSVLHIDNQVYHLGLEASSAYLKKTERAAQTLLGLYHSNALRSHENTLLSAYLRSKKLGLNHIFALIYKGFSKHIIKNLLSKNPSVLLLQFYKLLYISYTDLNTDSR